MSTAKEIFTEVWRENFGVDAELNKQLAIVLKHDYIFEAMERYAKQTKTDNLSIEQVLKSMKKNQ